MDAGHGSESGAREAPRMVVGIGASAGGLASLKEFFSNVPDDTGAAFVVVRHLDPDQSSRSSELVAERSDLSIRQAEDGLRLRADEIVFLPPGAVLRVEDGVLHLDSVSEEVGDRSVVDAFFQSLAEDRGSGAVGILLSGSGSDGTLGLKSIQENGGMTMVQHPDTAEFGGMAWSALRVGAVDYAEPIPELAAVLTEVLARGMEVAAAQPDDIPEGVLRRVAAIVRERTGHDFESYKRSTLRRRLLRRVQLRGVETFEEYVEELENDPEEVEALFGDLLIGVTEFFRDPGAWEVLAGSVIPRILDEAEGGSVRVWVPGCATGEEVYTVAMLLHEEARDRTDAPTFTVFGTDVDEEALSFAREGLYPDGIVDAVGSERIERYFTREDDHFRFDRNLRERCIFAPHDLLRDPPFSSLDLICCRNLLIYLRSEMQETALRVYQYGLRQGGYLFLGGSENLPGKDGLFDMVDESHRIFRRNEREGPPPAHLLDDVEVRAVDRLSRRAARAGTRTEPSSRRRREADPILSQEYEPAAVLTDDRREVLEFYGRSRRYLESTAGGGSDLLDVVLPELRGLLRAAFHEAVEEGREAGRGGAWADVGEGRVEEVDVTVRPADEVAGTPGRFLVSFRSRPAPETGDGSAARADTERRDFREELRDTRRRLRSTIEELESSNEELQVAREETQSVNEELQTVNNELRNKVDALDRARSDLENLFRSTQIATVFLDKGMSVKRFNPPATDLFRLRESDVGRSIEEIKKRFEDDYLEPEIGEVLEEGVPRQREIRRTEDDRWYVLRISPYRTLDNVIEGAVLTFTDITRIKETEERLRRERGYAQSIVETVGEPLVVLGGPELQVLSAGRAFYRTFGVAPDDVQGRRFLDLHPDGWNLSEERLESVRAGGQVLEDVEVEVRVAGDQTRILKLTARPVVPPAEQEGPSERILVHMQDITDLRRWEQEKLEEARRKDWFLTVLGHELRNPLASVVSGLDLLETGQIGDGEPDEVVSMMRRQAEQLRRLVDDLLDLSRIASGEIPLHRKRLDVTTLVRDAVEDHRPEIESGGRELRIELPDGPIRTRADGARLRQAIGNLLDNARTYTSSGDRITVRLQEEDDEPRLRLSVADTGEGIAPERVEHVFDPFERGGGREDLGDEGLGIGLTLVREIAEAHGGSADADSDGRGHGTVMTLRLPIEGAAETGGAATKEMEGGVGDEHPGSLRILVVEDQTITATMLTRLLEAEGHEVATARDGEGALEAAREFRPDVVLCDLGLPGSMDGNDVARALRSSSEPEDVRLVAVSGYGQDADRERSLAVGFDAYLVKPVRQVELKETLAGLFRGGPSETG